MNKKSIIIILIVIVMIALVWLVKNTQKKSIQNEENNVEEEINEDFKLNITTEINIEKLKEYKLPIIIDFGADYCAPCRQMAPTLKKLNKDLQGKAIVRYVDIWRYPSIAENYKIELIPTQILYNSDGTPYKPENPEKLGIEFIKNDKGEHIYTIHVGMLLENEMMNLLKEMGLNE